MTYHFLILIKGNIVLYLFPWLPNSWASDPSILSPLVSRSQAKGPNQEPCRNSSHCLHPSHDLATKCISMMVCMGWEDKFNALHRGAPRGNHSFFFITSGIWKVNVNKDGGVKCRTWGYSLSFNSWDFLENINYYQRLKTPEEMNRLYLQWIG